MAACLDGLPIELSAQIFGYVDDIKDRLQIRLTCKALEIAIASSDLHICTNDSLRSIYFDRQTPNDLTVYLGDFRIHADSMVELCNFRRKLYKRMTAEKLRINNGPSDPLVDDFIVEFLENTDVKTISIHFDDDPSPRLRDFLLLNADKEMELGLEGPTIDEDLLRSFKHSSEIGFAKSAARNMSWNLFIDLVSKGHTLISAPIVLTTPEQIHETLQKYLNSSNIEQNVDFTIVSRAYTEFTIQMSASDDWSRDYFDDYNITYAFKKARVREISKNADENPPTEIVELFKIQI